MKFNYLLLLLLPVIACEGKYTTSATSPLTTTFIRQLGSVSAAGTSGSDDECHASTVDSAGNSYCAGFTQGSLADTNAGGGFHEDSFLMKVDSNGEVVWITQFGSTTQPPGNAQSHASDDRCKGIAVDTSGNIYCAGYASGPMGEAHNALSSQDPFVTKLDSNGNVLWVTQLGATTMANNNDGGDSCWSVAVGGNNDAFVLKLNSDGVF